MFTRMTFIALILPKKNFCRFFFLWIDSVRIEVSNKFETMHLCFLFYLVFFSDFCRYWCLFVDDEYSIYCKSPWHFLNYNKNLNAMDDGILDHVETHEKCKAWRGKCTLAMNLKAVPVSVSINGYIFPYFCRLGAANIHDVVLYQCHWSSIFPTTVESWKS